MKKEEFVIVGTYVIMGAKRRKDIEVHSVNLNPQQVIGAPVDGVPLISIKKNKVIVTWRVKELNW